MLKYGLGSEIRTHTSYGQFFLRELWLPITSYPDIMKTTRKYTRYTKELLEPIVSTSYTYAECLRKLGLRSTGGNFKLLQRNIDKFKIDCSHMHHLAITQGQEIKPFEDLINPESIKSRLISERGHKCESCNLSEWLSSIIVLELEYVNGNNRDNSRENLKLLCPNCHSLTPTWRGRKNKICKETL